MEEQSKPTRFKRYCKTLTLKDNPELIEKYKEVHAIENTWPEVSQGMREMGILDMEIYIYENKLFMIMDTVLDFDHQQAMQDLAQKPRQAEWERYVSQFQDSSEDETADDKWQLMERIFKLYQQKEFDMNDGYVEICPTIKYLEGRI